MGMKIIGEPLFALDDEGNLKSRIGTMFFRTPGLVTRRGVHAMQRVMWIEELNAERAAAGRPPLTLSEEDEEMASSVDLIFTPDQVLIRPDPERMDLAFRADEELQKMVSKRKIRFLNTHAAKVRNALRDRGENWRMARQPITQEDMVNLIEASRVRVGCENIYYYNRATGTRYVTCAGYELVRGLPPDRYRAQVKELVELLKRRNRMGRPEADVFPCSTDVLIRNALRSIDVDALDDATLRAKVERVTLEWRLALPPELRDETTANFDWRNAMCHLLTTVPNETVAEEQELIQGISPEFYRQIEWLPGARISRGQVIFDPLWDEAQRTGDEELADICDSRVRNILFNLARHYGDVEFVNIGRIARSLARRPIAGARRGDVYLLQYRETGDAAVRLMVLRFQKWGVAEHLDEGKDLLRSILEADDYSDYIMDRRLMCRQLGMRLPVRVAFGQLTEPYHGENKYKGTNVHAYYYVRSYVTGTASDKVPPARFRNPAYALAFARLMGEAAALDLVVGRRATETNEVVFDTNYEVVKEGPDGLPSGLVVIDHAGSFVDYLDPFEKSISAYANVVIRRKSFVLDYAGFAAEYVEAFRRRLVEVREDYRQHRVAFDELLMHRPFDAAGSGAYRWAKALERLDACDPDALAESLRKAVGLSVGGVEGFHG